MPNTATTVVSYLCTNDAKAAIEFYTAGFGAVETTRLVDPKDGRIGHMEFRIGETTFFMADEYPEIGVLSPLAMPGTAVSFVIDVPDADALFARAVAAGATVERAMADQFHGNRSGSIRDPFGHRWMISSHIEDVTADEMQRRYDDGGEEA